MKTTENIFFFFLLFACKTCTQTGAHFSDVVSGCGGGAVPSVPAKSPPSAGFCSRSPSVLRDLTCTCAQTQEVVFFFLHLEPTHITNNLHCILRGGEDESRRPAVNSTETEAKSLTVRSARRAARGGGSGDSKVSSPSTPAGKSGLRAEPGVERGGFAPPRPSGSARGLQVAR